MKWLRRILGIRRRASLRLTPAYTARRVAELRKARAMFEGAAHV